MAIAILTKSGRINGKTPNLNANSQVKEATNFNCRTPIPNIKTIPKSIAIEFARINFTVELFSFAATLSTINPIKYEAIGNAIKYPPVGPKRIPRPAVNCEKTGIPTAPRSKYTICENAPSLLPNSAPDKRTAITCSVKGTGEKGRGIAICANTAVSAANNEQMDIFLIDNFINSLLLSTYNF